MNDPQNSLSNMTNEEAADIIKDMLDNTPWPRGDGKSTLRITRIFALMKAIEALVYASPCQYTNAQSNAGCCHLNKNVIYVTPEVYRCIKFNSSGVIVQAQGEPIMEINATGFGR